MTGRERVLSAIEHREPDKVPLDLGATPSSGISAIAYSNLVNHLDAADKRVKVFDVVQQVATPSLEVLNLFGADVLDIGRAFNTSDDDWYEITLSGHKMLWPAWFHTVGEKNALNVFHEDGTLIATMPEGATFFDQTYFPFIDGYPDDYSNLDTEMSRILWQKLAHSPWDHAGMDDFYLYLREKCIELKENTDKALVITCGCNLFEWGTFLRRIDNFLMDIYTDENEVERLLDELMVRHMSGLKKVCDAVGDVVDIIRFGDDLGMDSGPFFAPEIYRRLFKPRHKMLCDYVHKHTKMKTFLHSCGSIYKVMPDLIEAGYDIINPVQTTAADMEAEKLKREFGKDITFWGGGMNTRSVLNHAAPQQVYDHARRMIDIFGPGGGFVFNQEHNIMPDVPPENIIAMYRAVTDANA